MTQRNSWRGDIHGLEADNDDAEGKAGDFKQHRRGNQQLHQTPEPNGSPTGNDGPLENLALKSRRGFFLHLRFLLCDAENNARGGKLSEVSDPLSTSLADGISTGPKDGLRAQEFPGNLSRSRNKVLTMGRIGSGNLTDGRARGTLEQRGGEPFCFSLLVLAVGGRL